MVGNHEKERTMSDAHHEHHEEDPSVCFRVAVVFLAVIAAIAVIGILN